MSTNNGYAITVKDITIKITRKDIKNLHIGVYPPDGRVRVSAPLHVDDDNVRLAVIDKLGWISKQQARFRGQTRQSEREMVSGESHYVWGKRYLLEVVERQGKPKVIITGNKTLRLVIRPQTGREKRKHILNEWYRAEMKQTIPNLIEKWQPIVGEEVQEWGVKKMKTKWGSCNIEARRIWLNLELAKKPPECLEFILLHEMVHFLERQHNEVFRAYMDKFLSNWRFHRDILNQSPLAHEDWRY